MNDFNVQSLLHSESLKALSNTRISSCPNAFQEGKRLLTGLLSVASLLSAFVFCQGDINPWCLFLILVYIYI